MYTWFALMYTKCTFIYSQCTLIVFESQKAKNSWTKNSSELKTSALHARKNRPSWRKSWPLRKCRRKLLNCRRKSDYRAICKKSTAHCHYLQYTDCYSSFSAKILFPSNQKHVKHTAAFKFFLGEKSDRSYSPIGGLGWQPRYDFWCIEYESRTPLV